MSDAESSGAAEGPQRLHLLIVWAWCPWHLMILLHLACGGAHANTRSLDHIMQYHKAEPPDKPSTSKGLQRGFLKWLLSACFTPLQ